MYIYYKKHPRTDLEQEIVKRIELKKFNSFIYIVPTRRKVRFLTRELLELTPNKTIPQLNIFTIGDLAVKIFQEVLESWNPITTSIQYFLIKKIISESTLTYFQTKGKYIHNGVIELIISVISRLKELGISEEDFKQQIENIETRKKPKLQDISHIYSEYQKLLRRLLLYDLGEIYLIINKYNQDDFNKIFLNIFPAVNFLLISGFNEFTQPELDLIEKLSTVANLDVNVTLDFNKVNPEIFENLQKTHQRLIELEFKYIDEDHSKTNSHFTENVKKNLFQNSREHKLFVENVYCISAIDRRDEIETIARIIKNKIFHTPEIDLSKICIAINDINKYSNLIREIFFSYGIPVNITDRFYLKNSPVIISIISILQLINSDFFYKDLFNVLSSPYLDFGNIDTNNLRRTLEELKITRGYDKIFKAIELKIQYYENIDFEEELEKKILKIELLKKSKNDLESVYKLLEPLCVKQKPKSFVYALRNLIIKLRISEKVFETKLALSEKINIEAYEKEIKALKLFDKILDELIYSFEKLEEDKNFDLNFYYDFITAAISGSRYNIKERWGCGVLVTSPDEIRGLKFDTLFISGLNNGSFPTVYTPLIFLQENYIRNERQHLLEERYLFYQALCAFEKELYLTFASQDERRELIPSDFLIELKNLFDIKEFEKEYLNEFIFSTNDLIKLMHQYKFEQIEIKTQKIKEKLLRSNEINIRMLKRIKNNIQKDSEFCGVIKDDFLIKNFERIINGKTFTISEIEDYAKCPFLYLMKNTYNLEIEKEIEVDLDKREFGILIHNILHHFHKKFIIEDRNFYVDIKNNPTSLLKELEEISKAEFEKIQNFSPFLFLIESKIFGSAEESSLLENYLKLEERESSFCYKPYIFEVMLETSIEYNNKTVKIKGKIDRIDLDKSNKLIRIIDYKTGKNLPTKYHYENKITFQLPLYCKLIESAELHLPSDFSVENAHFFHLYADLKEQCKNISLRDEFLKYYSSDFDKAMNIILEELFRIIEEMKNGMFYLTQKPKSEKEICKNCNYKSICRVDWIEKMPQQILDEDEQFQ